MTAQELKNCHSRIKPYIHHTPVMKSETLNRISGGDLFFKCENFQKMGAFKMRGAVNAILNLSDEKRSKGVVTHSSGNFAQALSLAAQKIGVKAYIVMPQNAAEVKKEAVKGYGGIITECEPTLEAREKAAQKIEQMNGATFIHPSNDLNVIIGQGTAAMELLEDYPDLDYIVCPVGGGGLIAGTALAAHFMSEKCKVIGAEPFNTDDAYHSLKLGKIIPNTNTNTIADGLRTELGDVNFPIIQKYVHDIIRVEEQEIADALRLILERMKLVIEPSSATALAAVLREKERFAATKTGIILSGGNVELKKWVF